MSRWTHVTEAPPDPILGVSVAFNADPVRSGLIQRHICQSVYSFERRVMRR
jgi:hypothetical protein